MKKKHRILIHLAFWIYMANQVFLMLLLAKDKSYVPFSEYTIYPVTSLVTFYSIYIALDRVFKKRHKLIPVITLVLVIILLVPLRVGLEYLFWKYIGWHFIDPLALKKAGPLMVDRFWWFTSVRYVLIYGIYALLIRMAIGWFESQKLKSALLVEKQSGELALLRSQVNPHFLFNTLNNIYSLVYKKSEDAPAAVMKMSAIMRYMLYDATSDEVPLEKEVEYLKSFIELEKLRIRHQDLVELSIEGNLEMRTIAPMLLIPFVENAFKHGSKTREKPAIRISLEVRDNIIRFEVLNYIRKTNALAKDPVAGIGLTNIRRRLNLLYPSKHTLTIRNNEETFHVQLILKS